MEKIMTTTDEKSRRRWYSEEANRIITEADEDLLYEILRVRDAACALYARHTKQLTDSFKDADVIDWLDNLQLSAGDAGRNATIEYLTAQRDQAEEANRTLTAIIQEIQGGDAPLVGSIQAAKEAVEYSRTSFAKDIAREGRKPKNQ